jgi:hypothetical protein
MEALRAESFIAELCRKHSIQESTFYQWNKEFLVAGKKRLSGDLTREATSVVVADLRKENLKLKETLADLVLRYDIVKKFTRLGISEKLKRFVRLTASEKQEIIHSQNTKHSLRKSPF